MRWSSIVVVLAAAVSLTGCIVHHDSGSSTGDIELRWSFGGQSCGQTQIQEVHVTLYGPGGYQELQDDGYYKCSPNGTDGIVLYDFTPGTYTVTLDGLIVRNGQDQIWYSAGDQTITVRGNETRSVQIDLLPVASGAQFVPRLFAPSGAQYTDCATAGVAAFWIDIVDSQGNHAPSDGNGSWSTNCDLFLNGGFFYDWLRADDSFNPGSGKWNATWTVRMQAVDYRNYVVGETRVPAILEAGYSNVVFPIDIVLP